MSDLALKNNTEAEKPFIWRTKDRHLLLPVNEMNTKHLFYTLLMIWNHSAPKDAQIWFNHKYVFGPFYTPQYMLAAFRAIYVELKRRTDIGPRMSEVLTKMENYHRAKNILEIPEE